MTTKIAGSLVDGLGNPLANTQMKLVASATSVPLAGATAYYRTDDQGAYSFDMEIGSYVLYVWFGELGYQYIGNIDILVDTPDTSLDNILVIPKQAQPIVLSKILQALADAQAAASSASDAAEMAVSEALELIAPLGKAYENNASAQADITNGTIAAGAHFYIRSTSAGSLADEYVNSGGVPVATGKVMPSRNYIDGIMSSLRDNGLVGIKLDPATGYSYLMRDPVSKRCAMLVDTSGKIFMPLLQLPDGSVTMDSLDSNLTQILPVPLDPSTGFVYAMQDPVTKRNCMLVAVDGTVTIPLLAIGDNVITMDNLTDEVKMQFVPQESDVVDARPEPMRASLAEISVRTIRRAGSGWAVFPSHLCKYLSGVNTSGVALQFRRTAGLLFTGKANVGQFSPGALQSKAKIGRLTTTPVATPTGTFTAGDYYTYEVYSSNNNLSETTPGTWNGENIYLGDHLVYNGTSWAIQPSPGRGAQRAPDMYYEVSADGWFDGMELKAGDKLMFLTNQTAGGARMTPIWANIPSTSDRLFYAGEFSPSAPPSSPLANSVYQASSAGTMGVDTYAIGDYGWYNGTSWVRVPNDTSVIDVPPNGSVSLRCAGNSDEWEVRRADKNDVQVGVRMKAQVMTQVQEALGKKQLLISDSMFGQGSTGAQIIADSGVPGEVRSYGGSTSEQVLGMFKKEILSWGDNYKAQTIVCWHGQNNQPTTDINAAQCREVTMTMAALAGARDIKPFFLSIVGQRVMTWNGTRIVVQQHEDQFAKTGALYEISDWYKKMLPGRCAICYEILLSAATDAIDPTFPGMTEKQVAAKYGILPWSFFGGSVLGGLSTSQLVYKGTWTGSTLPSGGSDGDYYIRTDVNVGNIIYNSAGTWTENSIDRTHLSTAGGSALSKGGPGFDLGAGYTAIPARDGVSVILKTKHFYR
jgi:hypothetical protein|nr:MAG TPA: tail spike [Caudoviricetes sp.]